MARLRQVPGVLRTVGIFGFIRRIGREIHDDSLLVWACALAYSWLFAAFPFLIFLLTLAPYLPLDFKKTAAEILHASILAVLPEAAAIDVWAVISQNIDLVFNQQRRAVLSVGLLVTVWAASGGMNMTMIALDRCYDLPRSRSFYRRRLWAIGLTIVVATLILAVLTLLPVATIVTKWAVANYPGDISRSTLVLWNIARYTFAFLTMTAILALIYYFGPNIRQKFNPLTPGAVFCIFVWIALGLLFRIYVNRFGRYDRTYGSLGGAAILLLFFYLDALVPLIGAEINSEIDFACGVPRGSMDFRPVRPLFADTDESTDAEPSEAAPNTLPANNGTDCPTGIQ